MRRDADLRPQRARGAEVAVRLDQSIEHERHLRRDQLRHPEIEHRGSEHEPKDGPDPCVQPVVASPPPVEHRPLKGAVAADLGAIHVQPKQVVADPLDRRAYCVKHSAHCRPWPVDSDAGEDDGDEADRERKSE
jgi:hypothetical protein